MPPAETVADGMESPTVYTTSWCPYCAMLRGDLNRMGIAFTEIDIERSPEAAAIVEKLNRGNRTVPTVVYGDGTSATNPSAAEVAEKLAG